MLQEEATCVRAIPEVIEYVPDTASTPEWRHLEVLRNGRADLERNLKYGRRHDIGVSVVIPLQFRYFAAFLFG